MVPTLTKVYAYSLGFGVFEESYHVTPDKFVSWHRRWVAYADCPGPRKKLEEEANASEISRALKPL